MAQDRAALVIAIPVHYSVVAGVVEVNAIPRPHGVGHKDDRLRRGPICDQGPAHVQRIVPVELHHRPRLDGQRDPWDDAHVVVDYIGLVARPHGISGNRPRHRLLAAAGGHRKSQSSGVRTAVGGKGQSEGNSVVVASARGDGDRERCAVGHGLAGEDVPKGRCASHHRHVGVSGSEGASHIQGISPVVVDRNSERCTGAEVRPAVGCTVDAVAGIGQDGHRRLNRPGGVEAPAAQFALVARIEGVNGVGGVHQLRAHQPRRPVWMEGEQKPSQTRPKGRSHGGAGCPDVVTPQGGGQDVLARCRDIHPQSVVGEDRAGVTDGRTGHGDDVVVGCRIERVAGIVVADAANHHNVLGDGVGNGIPQRPRVSVATQREIDDPSALVRGVDNASGNVGVIGRPGGLHDLNWHDAAVAAHAGDADAVVRPGSSDAGD